MEIYQNVVKQILTEGNYKPNRTGIDTISTFSVHYKINLRKKFPLLTTKDMSGPRFQSMVKEVIWYLSGKHHIRDFDAKIWNEWADEKGNLETAYGRFWRMYPVPLLGRLEGEAWPDEQDRWITKHNDGSLTFDQVQYVIDTLKENPHSRRMVICAWHPANASISKLPPCHFTYVFNVQQDKLNLALFQRSADVALGVPYNIAAYWILGKAIAQQTGFKVGEFAHHLVDAHIYCGKGERGAFYENNLPELKAQISDVSPAEPEAFRDVAEWIKGIAPEEPKGEASYDHVPKLLEQLSRKPKPLPEFDIANKPLDDLVFEDFTLRDYESHDKLFFRVAE